MTREEVLERFCRLADNVNSEQFRWEYASDCFCGRVAPLVAGDYRFDEPVIAFIEAAVRTALAKRRLLDAFVAEEG